MDSWTIKIWEGEKKKSNTKHTGSSAMSNNKKQNTQKTQQIPYICYIGQTAEGNDESDF